MRKKPLDRRDSEQLRLVGANIRASRRGRLSLEELADCAGISAGQLSNIENGTGNPTVEMLLKVCSALGIAITDLVEPPPAPGTHVIRASERRRYRMPGMESDVLLLTPGLRHQLSVSLSSMEPGEQRTNDHQHRGDLLIYVLHGELRVDTADGTHKLGAGSSLLFPLPSTVTAGGTARAEFLAAFRPEEPR